MKKIITMAMMMTIAISATAMTYNQARNEALFLSDKMAYELGLTKSQYEAVYEINLDYLMSVNRQASLFGKYWTRRNNDIQYVLSAYQYRLFKNTEYFYRPMKWQNNTFTMTVYSRYSNRSKMYRGQPSAYSSYKGGNNRGSASYYKNRGVQKPSSHASGSKSGSISHGQSGSTTSFDHNIKPPHNTGTTGSGNKGRSGNGNSGNSNRPQRVFR